MQHKTQFVVALLCLFLSHSLAIVFSVSATDEECFYEDLKQGTPAVVMFQVVEGGFLDIDVSIKAPDGRLVYNQERQTEGKYSFTAHTSGLFSFCFGNRMSTLTPKTVSFVLNVAKKEEAPKNFDNITPLENSVNQLSDGLNSIINEQAYMKMREKVHRNTSESTNSRVVWWSVFEVVVLLAMSLWQIYYLRRFFEVKRVV